MARRLHSVTLGAPVGEMEQGTVTRLAGPDINALIVDSSDDELLLIWSSFKHIKNVRAKVAALIRGYTDFPTARPADWPKLLADLEATIDDMDRRIDMGSRLSAVGGATVIFRLEEALAVRAIQVSYKDFGGLEEKTYLAKTLKRSNQALLRTDARRIEDFDFTGPLRGNLVHLQDAKSIFERVAVQHGVRLGIGPAAAAFIIVIVKILAIAATITVIGVSLARGLVEGLGPGALRDAARDMAEGAKTGLIIVAAALGAVILGFGISQVV